MKIGVFGLGNVDLTTDACLLRRGFEVVGHAIPEAKRNELPSGAVPLSEPGPERAVLSGIADGCVSKAPMVTGENTIDALLMSAAVHERSGGCVPYASRQ